MVLFLFCVAMATRTPGIQLTKRVLTRPIYIPPLESCYRKRHTPYSLANYPDTRNFSHQIPGQAYKYRCYRTSAILCTHEAAVTDSSHGFDRYALGIVTKSWDSTESATAALQNLLDAIYAGNGSLNPAVLQKVQQFWVPYLDGLSVDKYTDYKKISGPLASLLVQYYSVKTNLERATDIFTGCSKLGTRMNWFSCNLLAFYTVQQSQNTNRRKDFLAILLTMAQCNYSFTLNGSLVDIWLENVLKAKDVDTLLAFISHFTDVMGSLSQKEVRGVFKFVPTYEILNSMAQLCVEREMFSVFSKLVGFTLKRMRADGISSARINEYRAGMSLARFNAYVKKLGAFQVILNGTFHTFGFAGGKHHCKTSDFPFLVHLLAAENPNLDYNTALHVIEQMNGYHIKENPARYSPVLHPLEQKSRIYKAALESKDADDDMMTAYSDLIRLLGGNAISRVGKPARMSSKYRNRASVSRHAPFSILPLNIILNVIANTNGNLKVALMLVKSMVTKHSASIDNETIIYLTRVFRENARSGPLLPSIIESFRKDFTLNRQLYLLVLDVLLECDGSPDDIYRYLKGYAHSGFLISGTLYGKVKEVFLKKNDDRYKQFRPSLDIFN